MMVNVWQERRSDPSHTVTFHLKRVSRALPCHSHARTRAIADSREGQQAGAGNLDMSQHSDKKTPTPKHAFFLQPSRMHYRRLIYYTMRSSQRTVTSRRSYAWWEPVGTKFGGPFVLAVTHHRVKRPQYRRIVPIFQEKKLPSSSSGAG